MCTGGACSRETMNAALLCSRFRPTERAAVEGECADGVVCSRRLSSRRLGGATSSLSHESRAVETLALRCGLSGGHGEPHQTRQAAVAAGVPTRVSTTVRTAARIIVLLGISQQAQERLHPGQSSVGHTSSSTKVATQQPFPCSSSSQEVAMSATFRGWRTRASAYPCQMRSHQRAARHGPVSPCRESQSAYPALPGRQRRVAL